MVHPQQIIQLLLVLLLLETYPPIGSLVLIGDWIDGDASG